MSKKTQKKDDLTSDFIAWHNKLDYINNQIRSLEEVRDIPLLSISIFLLKAQYIEFLLKQIIVTIDQYLFFSSSGKIVLPPLRTPRDLDKDNVKMLGNLIKEVKKYKGPMLNGLVDDLGALQRNRNKFTHKLYESNGSIQELHEEAKEGIILANRVIEEITMIEMIIKEEDAFEQYLNKN